MGIVDAINSVVGIKYKADIAQAKAAVKELSGEQKKAAKEQAEALEKQGKASEDMASQYAKGAAIIAGAFLAAKDGLEALRLDTRLSLGSVGIDIDRLDQAYGGLKTRIELLTLAQAGSSGAWQLNTQQIAAVIEGMRALEKRGYESSEVFTQFTEVLKKGKLEGLDKFGLSTKDLGSSSENLRSLMKQLAGQIDQVGGNFDKAGDNATRAGAKMEDALFRLREAAGLTLMGLEAIGEWFGTTAARAIWGDNAQSLSTGDPSRYAQRFAARRGFVGQGTSDVSSPLFRNQQGGVAGQSLFTAQTEADQQASAELESFRQRLRTGRGDFAGIEAAAYGLPAGWREVDPDLAARYDARLKLFRTTLDVGGAGSGFLGFKTVVGDGKDRSALNGQFAPTRFIDWSRPENREKLLDAGKNIADGFKVALSDAAVDMKAGARGGGGARGDDGSFYGNLARRGLGALRGLGARGGAERDKDAAMRTALRGDSSLVGGDTWGDGAILKGIEETQERLLAEMPGGKTWLESVFGPVDKIDAYREAMSTLGTTVQDFAGSVLKTWADGGELTTKALRKIVAGEISAEASKLQAKAISAILTGGYNTLTGDPRGPGQVAAGLAMEAGAIAIGGIARSLGGGSDSTGRGGGARHQVQDHRGRGGGGGGEVAATSQTILIGGISEFDSERYRAERLRDAMRRSGGYAPPQGGGPS